MRTAKELDLAIGEDVRALNRSGTLSDEQAERLLTFAKEGMRRSHIMSAVIVALAVVVIVAIGIGSEDGFTGQLVLIGLGFVAMFLVILYAILGAVVYFGLRRPARRRTIQSLTQKASVVRTKKSAVITFGSQMSRYSKRWRVPLSAVEGFQNKAVHTAYFNGEALHWFELGDGKTIDI